MAKASPLKQWHQGNGAEFAEESGWLLPRRFGDPAREYQAVRSGVGILDLCDRALLRFTGPDRISYLQGMVSNDVKKPTAGEGIYAAILDIQGKILADARLFCLDNAFLLELWEPLKEKILAHLNHYLVADDVEIADLAGQHAVLSLQGPKSPLLLKELFPNTEPLSSDLAHRALHLDTAEVRVVRSSHTGEQGYDLFVPAKDLLHAVSVVQEKGKSLSLSWVGAEAREILRIEAGILRYGVDMSEDNLLLETGLERAVSFHKGCYLGQEVVERIRSRGHVNRKLAGLALEGKTTPVRGSAIRAGGKEIGTVTSAALSPARKLAVALGYVHRDYLEPGTAVTIESEGATLPATVSPLPFYSPAGSLESPEELR